MKKKIRGSMLGIVLMLGSFGMFMQNAYAGPGDQTIADDQIKCKCTWIGKCKASGGGSLCAQSEGGGNISCQDYNGNC